MTASPYARRLTTALTLALLLGALALALLGPAQTLAQTRRACPSSGHSKTRHAAHACKQSSHRGKSKTRHAVKRHVKPAPTRKSSKTGAAGPSTLLPALCEDGERPVRAADGGFSCEDGSEPECESGATPTASHKANTLVCPASGEAESSAADAECEEEGLACSTAAGEQPCETSGSDGSSFSCEADSED